MPLKFRGICDHAGIRTQDPILKRDVLYLLSYVVVRIILIFFGGAKVEVLLILARVFG